MREANRIWTTQICIGGKMKTTELYFEMILIGLETSVWISFSFVNIIGNVIVDLIYKVLNNFSSSLLLIGIFYIIGVLLDRFADIVFQERENYYRRKSGFKNKTSVAIWQKNNVEKYAEFTRVRGRILRASIINLPLITLTLIWYIFNNLCSLNLIFYILALGILFTYVAWKSYNETLEKYYARAHILEMSEKDDVKVAQENKKDEKNDIQ